MVDIRNENEIGWEEEDLSGASFSSNYRECAVTAKFINNPSNELTNHAFHHWHSTNEFKRLLIFREQEEDHPKESSSSCYKF